MGAVRIERLRCRYRVARAQPAPGELALRLDRVLRDRVPGACAAMLAGAVPADDPGIVLIRRLDVRLILRHGLPDDIHTAAMWSQGITVAIAQAVAGDPDAQRVVRFDDLVGSERDAPVAAAIDAVRGQTEQLRVLGSYPAA